jgi:hypothetical protein
MGLLTMTTTKEVPNHFVGTIKLGYLETKYHGLLLLNYDAQPSLHTQCHCGG